MVKGHRLKLLWGKPQAPRPAAEGGAAGGGAAAAAAGQPSGSGFPSYMPAAPGAYSYSSMDPLAMGSRQPQAGGPPRPPGPPPVPRQ